MCLGFDVFALMSMCPLFDFLGFGCMVLCELDAMASTIRHWERQVC